MFEHRGASTAERNIKTIAANFAIPNDGIEQMARKSDGAGATPKQI